MVRFGRLVSTYCELAADAPVLAEVRGGRGGGVGARVDGSRVVAEVGAAVDARVVAEVGAPVVAEVGAAVDAAVFCLCKRGSAGRAFEEPTSGTSVVSKCLFRHGGSDGTSPGLPGTSSSSVDASLGSGVMAAWMEEVTL